MLRIKDPEKSLRFYNDCFGLHVVFIFNVGPWAIYYLGPRDVGMYPPKTRRIRKRGKGRRIEGGTSGEVQDCFHTDDNVDIKCIGTSKGLLELYHIPSDSSLSYTSGNDYDNPSGIGFGHIGFTVPDVAAALERVKSFGFEVIKPLDEAKVESMGVPGAVVSGQAGEVPEGYKNVFKQLAFVKDPDVSGRCEGRD
jgi:lactoylglutathione lyase